MSLREPTAPALPSWVRTAAPVGVGILGLVAWVLYVDVAAAAPRMLPSPIAIAQEFVLRWNIIAEGMAVTATNAFVGLIADRSSPSRWPRSPRRSGRSTGCWPPSSRRSR